MTRISWFGLFVVGGDEGYTSRALLVLVTAGLLSATAVAQTLEFAAGAGNPTGDGPSLAPVTIQFQENTNDPADNVMVAYPGPVRATFSLLNQQFPNATTELNGMVFGARSTGNTPPTPGALFPTMDYIGVFNGDDFLFSSTPANAAGGPLAGEGIELTVNRGVALILPTYGISQLAQQPATSVDRIYVGDLRVSFNAPVQNPVLQLSGLGADNNGLGFTAELELTTAGVTPSFLSGWALDVSGGNINNSSGIPLNALTGAGGHRARCC